jgi:hypothetical protein
MAERFDFCAASDWEHDRAFFEAMRSECQKLDVSFFGVEESGVDEALSMVQNGEITFLSHLNRGWEADQRYMRLVEAVRPAGCCVFNDPTLSKMAIDKSAMHGRLLARHVVLPHTLVVASPCDNAPFAGLPEEPPSRPFYVKPAVGGGGEGVYLVQQVAEVSKLPVASCGQKILLQEIIRPAEIGVRKAWFRVFYVFGDTHPCWWDRETHVFAILDAADERRHGLARLHDISRTIAELSGLDFFSSEICLTSDGSFVAVDYVNDPCDMRRKSLARDGVPDVVVDAVVCRIAEAAAAITTGKEGS